MTKRTVTVDEIMSASSYPDWMSTTRNGAGLSLAEWAIAAGYAPGAVYGSAELHAAFVRGVTPDAASVRGGRRLTEA